MTRPWVQADLIRLKMMVRQNASAADIARSLGRRMGSVKTKVREMGLVPLKSRASERFPRAIEQVTAAFVWMPTKLRTR
jgi:hypothetical protein